MESGGIQEKAKLTGHFNGKRPAVEDFGDTAQPMNNTGNTHKTTVAQRSNHTPKYLLLGSLYVAQSVPVAFFETGFQTFLRSQNIDYKSISYMMGLMMTPWLIKALWAPWLDRLNQNNASKIRSKILIFQVIGFILLAATSFLSFSQDLFIITCIFLLFNFVAATQDIVIDSFAVLALPKKEHGMGNTLQMGGYYGGKVLGGALVLIIFDQYGWQPAMLSFALFFMFPFIPTLFHNISKDKIQVADTKEPVGDWRGFFNQKGIIIWIIIMVIYMGNQVLARVLLPSMLKDMGYSNTAIGAIKEVWGNTASILGALVAGLLVNRLGRKRSLVSFGLVKIVTILLFLCITEKIWTGTVSVYGIILLNDFVAGLAAVSLFTIMMDKCRLSSPGTDFSIQQSLNTIGIIFFVSISGAIVKHYSGNFTPLFLLASVIGLAAVLLVVFGMKEKSLES